MRNLIVRSRCKNRAVIERAGEKRFLDLPALDEAQHGRSGFITKLSYPERDLLSHTNHACPIANTANRRDNHGHWNRNRVATQSRTALFATCPASVNRAGVSAKGFVWLTVSRRIPKAPNLSHRNDNSSNRGRYGFCLQPTERSKLSNQV